MLWLHAIDCSVETDSTKQGRLTPALPLLIQSITFWLVVWGLRAESVSAQAWVALYAAGVGAALAMQHPRFDAYRFPSSAWLLFAVNSVLVAALFWGATVGLELITVRQHANAAWSAYLGGLELWFALCPGALSVAIAGWTRSLQLQRLRPPRNDEAA